MLTEEDARPTSDENDPASYTFNKRKFNLVPANQVDNYEYKGDPSKETDSEDRENKPEKKKPKKEEPKKWRKTKNGWTNEGGGDGKPLIVSPFNRSRPPLNTCKKK